MVFMVLIVLILLTVASACEPGRGRVQVVHPVGDSPVPSVDGDAGPDAGDASVDASPDASDADVEPQPPRIAIPRLEGEPLARVSIHRGKGPVVFEGKGLKLNGAAHRGTLEIVWSESGATQRGKALADGAKVTADGDVRLRRVGRFPGTLLVYHSSSHLLVVNEVPLERYLQTVVQSEVPAIWRPEAHKAQAVAARTYALARMAQQSGQYSLESTVMDQVYRPRRLDARIVAAVKATRGQVLVAGGGLIETKYHSTCGGRTENPDEVWPELGMGHQWSTSCWTCRSSPYYRWALALTLAELKTRLVTVRSGLKRVKSVEVTQKSGAGRVLRLAVHTEKGSFEMTGRDFRRAVSLRKVRSTYFDVRPSPRGIKILGRGFGHGVGMCQWGASGMAEAGRSYTEILKHYYRGAELHRAYE